MKHKEEQAMIIIAFLCAVLLASHGASIGTKAGPLSLYFYWIVRILFEALLFFGARAVLEKYSDTGRSLITTTFLAIFVSHLPFVLSVTALDIVLGIPELGLDAADAPSQPRLSAFGFELLYLFDNHLALCLLLSGPRFVTASHARESVVEEEDDNRSTFLSTLDPSLVGDLIWVEAQEHYVRLTTTQETRMVLARFSDIVRELQDANGMQVHRSHWVSKNAIQHKQKDGQSVVLVLENGDRVPVSRSFRHQLS